MAATLRQRWQRPPRLRTVGSDGEVLSADERHELRLFGHHEYAGAFLAAGLDTSWDPEGLTGRGLLVGVAPGGPGAAAW